MSAAKLDSEPSPSTIRTPVAAAPLSPASPPSWVTSTRVTATPARLAEISPRSAETPREEDQGWNTQCRPAECRYSRIPIHRRRFAPARRPSRTARAASSSRARTRPADSERRTTRRPAPLPAAARRREIGRDQPEIRPRLDLHRLQQREDGGRLVWRQADVPTRSEDSSGLGCVGAARRGERPGAHKNTTPGPKTHKHRQSRRERQRRQSEVSAGSQEGECPD